MNSNTSSSSSLITLPSPIGEDKLEWKKHVPHGVKFSPSNKDILYYLRMKVRTGHIDVHGVIRSIDLYMYEPQDLKGLAFDHGDGNLYFFTQLENKFKTGPGKRKNRLTRHGSWRVTQKKEQIMGDNKKPIMTKTPLCYYYHGGKGKKKSQWLMDEYKLINEDDHSVNMLERWALCVVQYKAKKGTDVEQMENKTSSTSSVDSMSETVVSAIDNLMVGSSNESSPHISLGSFSNVASQPYSQALNYSTSYYQPMHNTFSPTFDLSQASQPSLHYSSNFDVLPINNVDSLCFDDNSSYILSHDPSDYLSWENVLYHPSEPYPPNSNLNLMNPIATNRAPVSASNPSALTFISSADGNGSQVCMATYLI